MTTKTVAVKSSWASKINWTQGLSVLAGVLAMFGVDLDPETRAQIASGILGINAAVTWVLRTWFTSKVTKASADRA